MQLFTASKNLLSHVYTSLKRRGNFGGLCK